MDNRTALDPKRSVVVEACAGSGKTWLLVSRIVRLLLDGAQPSQILAITFTRKAAQEMQARLQLWLRDLALKDDAFVREFFAERGVETLSDAQLQRVRSLYSNVLLAQPGIAISTFHGWFMQVMQRAPLNAGVMQGMSLLERAGSAQEEAWEELLEQMRKQPDGVAARHMQWLFGECGLYNTRKLLFNFLAKRAEWWTYTQGQQDALVFALDGLRADLEVDMAFDPVADWGRSGSSEAVLFAFIRQLANNGTDVQKKKAMALESAWTDSSLEERFGAVCPLMLTQKNIMDGRIKPNTKQDAATFETTRNALAVSVQEVFNTLAEQQAYRLNEAVLHCGAALLARYQALKQQKQQMDFSDLEWQLCRLLQQSEHAETMQYKLDSRYRHVLLDEFQDTNPLQWQILRAWFDVAVAVESQPTVFVVGDPRQSIYRFRRADARLFGVAREYLQAHFAAATLGNSLTRRNSQPVVDAVNAVFREQPDGFEFVEHQTHQRDLPGHVTVLPLAVAEETSPLMEPLAIRLDGKAAKSLVIPQAGEGGGIEINLRDPLTTPRVESEEGARHKEAVQFAELLQTIVSDWSVNDEEKDRHATWGDIMVLVRSRTHLAVYEEALRARHVPFISSRRGGLLDTLEAEDVQALLMFLITPFADLALAQVLRTPVFACSDADLMALGFGNWDSGFESEAMNEDKATVLPKSKIPNPKSSWWQRLQQLAEPSPALQRAASLLKNWLALADKLPVHDLLDRIYFEGDVLARYTAVLPPEMRAKVAANLHAFMEIALSVDAGRYPSLPRFLQELRELRDSPDDAPAEGRLGVAGNAVRIYTVHESKGLEAPIVWLLDANAEKNSREGNDVLLDWPTHEIQPLHFSMYADQASHGRKRAPLFEQDAAQQAREEMNLLYVAMTRAQQALIVSGNSKGEDKEGKKKAPSWYDRIAAVVTQTLQPVILAQAGIQIVEQASRSETNPLCRPLRGDNDSLDSGLRRNDISIAVELPPIIPTGKRAARNTVQQQRGIWLHALLQHLTPDSPRPQAGEGSGERAELQQRLAIPSTEMESLWQQARHLLASPQLSRFFDVRQYRSACNEMPYVNAKGELKRIDRLVEFDEEVWVLDYKLGAPKAGNPLSAEADAELTHSEDAARYRAQMQEYRTAMQAVYAGKTVRCALVFADGMLGEAE